MKTTVNYFTLFVILLGTSTSIQAQYNLYVKQNNGTQVSYLLSDIRKITFPSGKVEITTNSGKNQSDSTKNVRYLSFIDYTPNFTTLNKTLVLANAVSKTVGTDPGQYAQADVTTLINAITVATNAKATVKTQTQIDNANTALANALAIFKTKIVPPVYTALDATIVKANAESKIVGKNLGQYAQADVTTFINAITAATNEKATATTQTQIDNANTTLVSAIAAFKATVNTQTTESSLVESLGKNNLLVFPSPAKDDLTIRYQSTESGTLDIRIIDMQGHILLEQSHNNIQGENSIKLNISQLAAGSYVVSNGLESKEFIKK